MRHFNIDMERDHCHAWFKVKFTSSMKANGFQLFTALLFVGSISTASAGVVLDLSPSNGVPPATLGPYQMTLFPLNDSDPPPGSLVTSVSSPLGGSVGFSSGLQHLRTDPSGGYNVWNPSVNWGNGYNGDVYYANPITGFPLGVQLPPGTKGFYFYIQPQPIVGFTNHGFLFTVFGADGISPVLSTSFNLDQTKDAQYVGIFSDTPSDGVGRLAIQNPSGYAIGEFGIAVVPEPGTLTVLGMMGILVLTYKKWIKRVSRHASANQ